ncbi:LysR family transcriptional regulator [Geminicoccus roseus]|uniref:LysR family transcriptional regulator n=1 Tax=Geminicoccus roseus TaxID=404900 RepID=UPI000684FF97|nr:LysR family transcriptional regulator [Geminicoccus roseus]
MSVDESYQDDGLKLHDLRCFDAVVRTGSFQAAAAALHRTHPSVFAAVGRLEARLRLVLLDRSGYRVLPTEAGRSFHAHVGASLAEIARLSAHARLLAGGEEPVLRVVLGDLCPLPVVLPLLSEFFAGVAATRLHLDYEAVGGPAGRLRHGTADLIFHRAEAMAVPVERIDLAEIRLVPVAAPGFLPPHLGPDLRPDQLRPFTQCVIRDSARGGNEDHFLVPGAHPCSVPDHAMKRELILHGMGWGHLPDFMVAGDLEAGRLVRIRGRHLPGGVEILAASRRSDLPHGPVAERLWRHLRARFPGR